MDYTSKLKYVDAEDKCFGVVGMTLGLFLLDAEQYLVSVSIDRSNMESIEMSPEFQFPRNQSISPKTVWNHILKRFNLVSALLISNILCRYYIHRHQGINAEIRRELLQYLEEEGTETCQLERDEIESIFNENLMQLDHAFRSSQINTVAHRLYENLKSNHTLSFDTILEIIK